MTNENNKSIKKILLFFMIAMLFILLNGQTVFATDSEDTVIKVAFPQAKGINEVYEDGSYGGCTYDWLMEIAKYTGWKYEFITEGDTSEQINYIRNGECDIMGGMYYREEFEEYYNYPQYIMGSNYSLLIYSQDNLDIKGYDYSTFNGKKIGVYKRATAKIERLKEFLMFNNISYELVYYDDHDQYQDCLENGEVDMMLGTDLYIKDHYNVATMIPAEAYYLITAKDKPELCKEMSEAMEAIYAAYPNFATDLYKKYFPNTYINSIVFTEEEKEFIKNADPIKIAVIENRYPMYYKEDGVSKGIIPETLQLISERTGLKFEYVYGQTHQERIKLMQAGQADIIGGFLDDDRAAESFGLVRTSSIVMLDTAILRNKQSGGKNGKLIMAMPGGRVMRTDNSSDTIVYYDTYEDCLNAVNRGEADYTRMAASVVGDFLSRDYYANITMITDIDQTDEVTIALPTPLNVQLYSVLNKAINNFSEEETRFILTNNSLHIHENKITLKNLFHRNPVMTICVITGVIVLLSSIVILLEMYRMKSKIMQMKLEKAMETSKTKSDFLARMSHEIRTPMNAIIGLTNLAKLSGEATPTLQENLSKIDSSAKFLLSLLNDVLDMSKIENEMLKIEPVPFNLVQLASALESMFANQAQDKGLSLEVSCNLKNRNYIGDKMRIQQVLTNLLSNACKFTNKGGTVQLIITEEDDTSESSRLRFTVKDSGIGIKEEDIKKIFDSFEQVKNSNVHAPGTGLGLSISKKIVELMGGELHAKSKIGFGSEFYFTIDMPIYMGELHDEFAVQGVSADQLSGMNVLLVEDNDLNAEIAVELLKMIDIEVERTADGKQAVQRFSESEEGFFDVILMDVNMPEMDGLTATVKIREMNRRDAKNIPIIAMTANTFKEDQDKAMQSGMTGFLPKPFDVDQLYHVLESIRQKQ